MTIPTPALEITISAPADTTDEQLKAIARQAAFCSDLLHRSYGGNGLQVEKVEALDPDDDVAQWLDMLLEEDPYFNATP
ncbi:MAG: hypothetical protein AAGD25_06785 [Cyanobacteria bacterium P01_F01_bin.150]